MKALELLVESKEAMLLFMNSIDNDSENDSEFISALAYLEQLNVSIKELEALEIELKQGQENYDKLWDMYSELKREK